MKADGMTEGGFRFQPLDRPALWRSLVLTMSQASALTGASERQIQHWMDRGYIAPATRGTRKINGESIDAIILIRQARAAGIPLRRAVDMARTYLDAEANAAWTSALAPMDLRDLKDILRAARTGIEMVEDVIENVERNGGTAHKR
jgi:DNA-binding transcriptional MerR regulator